MNESDLIKTLAMNGPWAVAFFFLLRTVLNAWMGDRKANTDLMGEFRTAIVDLKNSIDKLTEHVKDCPRKETK